MQPSHLYMRIDDAITYDVSQGHDVTYVGMNGAGTEVFFTTEQQLTAEDHDSSVDLYMWSEAGEKEGNPLTLISKGDNPGNPGEPARVIPATPPLRPGAVWNSSPPALTASRFWVSVETAYPTTSSPPKAVTFTSSPRSSSMAPAVLRTGRISTTIATDRCNTSPPSRQGRPAS